LLGVLDGARGDARPERLARGVAPLLELGARVARACRLLRAGAGGRRLLLAAACGQRDDDDDERFLQHVRDTFAESIESMVHRSPSVPSSSSGITQVRSSSATV